MARKLGAHIAWQDLSFSVTDRATGAQKQILSDVSGFAQPGRLLSIMGPSGAGKSTLLDLLAGNAVHAAGARLDGGVLVDGRPRHMRSFRAISCYVQQKDVLLSSATVREALLTSALLNMPMSMPMAEKRERVESVLRELDLLGCAEVLVGDETIGIKGISGGQKRRVSVGIELVKDPRVLFLDEPTSGLDSEMALSLMTTLVTLARKGRTVVCTIHQPNSDITDNFDDYLLLSAGRAVYGGVWAGAVDFFAEVGYSCPSFKNPCDYFMGVIRDPEATEALATAYTKARPALLQHMEEAGRATLASVASQRAASMRAPTNGGGVQQQQQQQDGDAVIELGGLDKDLGRQLAPRDSGQSGLSEEEGGRGAEGEESLAGDELTARVPMWYQVLVLSTRYWRTWVRNPIMMWSELMQYTFMAVFIGLMYHKFNDTLGEGDFDRSACVWFAFAILCFTPSYTAVTNWASERLLLKRELGQRLYGVNAYYLARYSVLLPFEVLQCLLFVAVFYFFTGFHASASGFFLFFAVFSMFQIISEGIGACCAVVTKTATFAVLILTFVLLILLAFSGFLASKVPVYFVWVQKTSYLTYAFAALVEKEFSQIEFYDPKTGEMVPGMSAFPSTLHTGLSMSQNVGILAAQLAGMELIKLFAFHVAARFNMM